MKKDDKARGKAAHFAMIGLGRMGMNMAVRLLRAGHPLVAYNRHPDKVRAAARAGAVGAASLEEAVRRLRPPRVVWLMIPAGRPVREAVRSLAGLLEKGDTVVDGGNSNYKDDAAHAALLAERGVSYIDVGVSGGIWGLEAGYCLMAGGDPKVFRGLQPYFKSLAQGGGCLLAGPVGAGHFAKMIHNGVEYGMMQAYAEGFDILRSSGFGYDLRALARLWNRGSVVRSWLLELAERAFAKDPGLKSIKGWVDDSGEGRWALLEAVDKGVPAPVIAAALFARFRSRRGDAFSDRVLAALRNEFGGHAVRKR